MAIVECASALRELPTEGGRAPLKPATLRKWFAVEWETAEHELVATTTLMTGLSGAEVRHLTADWLVEEKGEMFICLPNRARCVVRSDYPCLMCRRHRGGYFTSTLRPRRVPVHDEQLVENLRVLAKHKEHLTFDNVDHVISNMLDRSTIERDVFWKALEHTHGVALAAKGYDREEIHRWTGKSPDTVYGNMSYSKDYVAVASNSPWAELEMLGSGEFRP